nr:hypothetical protein [Clostridium ganghwense]
MESWQSWFMIGSGIYLILLGIFMFRKKDQGVRKVVGVYNFLVGILSIVAAVIARFNTNIANTIFLVYAAVLVVSFIIFAVLRSTEKQR